MWKKLFFKKNMLTQNQNSVHLGYVSVSGMEQERQSKLLLMFKFPG